MSKDIMEVASDNLKRHLGEPNATKKYAVKAKKEDLEELHPSFPQNNTTLSEEDEERRAMEALVQKAYDSALRVSGDPALAMKVASDFANIISQVFSPHGGSDNFVNLRSPGQRPAKQNASPGNSGNYDREGYAGYGGERQDEEGPNTPSNPSHTMGTPYFTPRRGDGTREMEQGGRPQGSKGEYSQTDAQSYTNPIGRRVPPASLDTRQNVPSALYDRPTSILTGSGFQPQPIPNMYDNRKSVDEMSIIKESRRLEVDEYTRPAREGLGLTDEAPFAERSSAVGSASMGYRDSPREEPMTSPGTVDQLAMQEAREQGVLSQTLKPEERRQMEDSEKLDGEAEFLEREARKEEMIGDLGYSKQLKEKAKTLRSDAMKGRSNLGTSKNFGY